MASLLICIQQLHLAVSMPEKLKEIKLSCKPNDARVKISDLSLDHSKLCLQTPRWENLFMHISMTKRAVKEFCVTETSWSCALFQLLRNGSPQTPVYICKKQKSWKLQAFTSVQDDFCLDFRVPTAAFYCLLCFTLFFFFKDVSTLVQCTSQNERLSFESKCIFLWCWTWTPHSSDNDETLFSVVCFSSFQQPSTWNMIRTAELINYPYFYLFSVEVVAKHGDKFF